MAKKKNKKKSVLGTILIFVGLIIALSSLACLAGPALSQSIEQKILFFDFKGTVSYSLGGFLTGTLVPAITLASGGDVGKVPAEIVNKFSIEGYMSYFVLFAIIALALATLFTVIGLFLKKGKLLVILGGLLFITSGVLIFLIKIAGTAPENGLAFTEIFNNETFPYALGMGTIFYGILSAIGGLIVTIGGIAKK